MSHPITRSLLFVFAFSLAILTSCSTSRKEEKKAEDDLVSFLDEATGWSTKYPTSWKKMSDAEIAQIEGRGLEAMQEATDEPIGTDHTSILYLKKDQFNMFTSSWQAFDEEVDGSYEENHEMLVQAILDTFTAQGIDFDHKTSTATIDGLPFNVLETSLYAPGTKNVILHQVIYDRLVDKKVLTLNVNYNNEDNKKILLDIINASKFSKRD